ncbi:hypothetical protein [Oceanospirillum linum]|uniref:Uncharacterized protein n=1 Tax=Oceanospirillum linum TaxID=966 RepID=A0A1T1HEQ4_OCELI|nr:hypothetical protein [Oceanospirillum linum]OOV88329.1 hypothetical protein BTA35_0202085 [Oceanospirillum linum]SEF52478.1 hypothetical protein SAMN04489856_101428 [Oleiphilus messinensis]SMP04463.1 hypothetical protein SAMN06264348_101429 [Oceanospirillum linum]
MTDQNLQTTLVLAEHQRQLFTFMQTPDKPESWQLFKPRGELSLPATGNDCWQKALDEITDFHNRSSGLAACSVFVLSDRLGLFAQSELLEPLQQAQAQQCQLIRLSWLAERSGTLPPASADADWLQQYILPELVSVPEAEAQVDSISDQELSEELQNAQVQLKDLQQRIKQLTNSEQQLKQQLQEKEQALQVTQGDMEALKRRSDALVSGELTMMQLTTLLPALYKNFWSSISPSDLALLAGTTEVPQIRSPVHEPTDAVIQTLKKRIQVLHSSQKEELRQLCRQLPRQFTVRPEMQFFFEDEACV